jgi:hypothetical protein
MEEEVWDRSPVGKGWPIFYQLVFINLGEFSLASVKTAYIRRNANFQARRKIKEFKYSFTFGTDCELVSW